MKYPKIIFPKDYEQISAIQPVPPPHPLKPKKPIEPKNPESERRAILSTFLLSFCFFAGIIFFASVSKIITSILSLLLIIFIVRLIYLFNVIKNYEESLIIYKSRLLKYQTGDIIYFNKKLGDYEKSYLELFNEKNLLLFRKSHWSKLNFLIPQMDTKIYEQTKPIFLLQNPLLEKFDSLIKRNYYFEIFDGYYYLDLAYIDNENKNFINIEIDEPFAQESYEGGNIRNFNYRIEEEFFKNNWFIIRFAEEQVLLKPDFCCEVIALVINSHKSFSANNLKYLQHDDLWLDLSYDIIPQYRLTYYPTNNSKIKTPMEKFNEINKDTIKEWDLKRERMMTEVFYEDDLPF